MWEAIKKPGRVRSLFAFTVSAAIAMTLYILGSWGSPSGSALDRSQGPSHGPASLLIQWRIHNYLTLLGTWPWIAFVFLVFAIMGVLERNRDKGWTAAMAAGLSFVTLVYQIFLKF